GVGDVADPVGKAGCLELVLVAGADYHPGAAVLKGLGDGPSDSPGAARDVDNPVLDRKKVVHSEIMTLMADSEPSSRRWMSGGASARPTRWVMISLARTLASS